MSAKLRAALATVLVMETIEGAHHAARIALEASEPPATGLDVERLREALTSLVRQYHAQNVNADERAHRLVHRPGSHLNCDDHFCLATTSALWEADYLADTRAAIRSAAPVEPEREKP